MKAKEFKVKRNTVLLSKIFASGQEGASGSFFWRGWLITLIIIGNIVAALSSSSML